LVFRAEEEEDVEAAGGENAATENPAWLLLSDWEIRRGRPEKGGGNRLKAWTGSTP